MKSARIRTLAVLAGIMLLAAACSDSKKIEGADGSSTSSSVAETTTSSTESTTTTSVVTETTLGPTTLPPASTTPATPAPTPAPTTPPPSGTVLGQPTNLQATPEGGIVLDSSFDCSYDPGIPGYTVVDCQYQPSYNDGITALVMQADDDGHFYVAVLIAFAGHLEQRYWAEEDEPGIWESVTLLVGDFNADDGAEVWIGYRYAGSGGYLDLDVLDPRPAGVWFLGGLQGLDHGQVDVHPGGATVLTAVYSGSDPNCCPSNFLVREVTFASNQWRINTGTTYPAASVPSVFSDF